MSPNYPSQPIVGVGGIILEGGRVLLVRRGAEPLRGVWSIPGGKLHLGERLEDGLRREIREEVGIEVRVLQVADVFERITPDDAGRVLYHFVLIDYLCQPLSGALQAGDDAAEVKWVDRQHLAEYTITEGTVEVIERAFALRDKLEVPC